VAPEREFPVGGWSLRADLRDRIVGYSLYVYRGYDPELQRFIGLLDLAGGTVADVGANLGWHTLALSQAVGPTGRVMAFEPEARNYELLRGNVERNGARNVTALNCGLSDQVGTARLNLHPSNFGDHRLAAADDSVRTVQEIKLTTLDQALAEVPAGALKFVKIDVQGHELQVLRGMGTTLARHPDVVLAVEISPDLLPAAGCSATALMTFLQAAGFDGWEMQPHRVMPLAAPWAYDLIREGHWADILVSRNHELLRRVLSRYAGVELPVGRGWADRTAAANA